MRKKSVIITLMGLFLTVIVWTTPTEAAKKLAQNLKQTQ